MSLLISFTSGIPDYRHHDVWKKEYSQARLESTGGRGYDYLAAKLTYFIRRA
jgi:hypothetical protein